LKRLILLATAIAFLSGCTAQMVVGSIFAVVAEKDNKKPVELDPARPVKEQNCTEPVENSGGNLRCR